MKNRYVLAALGLLLIQIDPLHADTEKRAPNVAEPAATEQAPVVPIETETKLADNSSADDRVSWSDLWD